MNQDKLIFDLYSVILCSGIDAEGVAGRARTYLADKLAPNKEPIEIINTEPATLVEILDAVKLNRVRICNALQIAGIRTTEELLDWNSRELLKLPNFGNDSLYYLTLALTDCHMKLREI